MKKLLLQYKPFLLFLGKFFLSYLILTLIYQTYLNQFDVKNAEIDGFTNSVAKQTELVLSLFDDQSYTMPHLTEPSVKLYYKNKYISRIIEGCNGLSVMILFVAFVIAFSGKFKNTIVFILLGLVVIHVLNVLRIALLSVALYSFPEYEHFLHGVVFPLVIYGVVFLLWVIWVNNYSSYARVSKK
ncbi:exosortase family protein XrtF [Flavobacterium capsici]|uniref:Exosortase family protein XrtF n=1 Tax=Flavobacterium capsici TaxID=3075618 RepID=A0AA96F3B4_9FLAO|nr:MULTISPECIES: exosortase family protein XrtF [unclassified Flavobacterium]WNM19166.1 exosortase family protein XrtF [Flavobacterium sp. PMR2A8]WNM20555.1 exosortase family protein XrtF [Flavobacterium sp. PMTSA4]